MAALDPSFLGGNFSDHEAMSAIELLFLLWNYFFTKSPPLGITSLSKNQHLFKDPGISPIIIMLGLKRFIPNLCLFLWKTMRRRWGREREESLSDVAAGKSWAELVADPSVLVWDFTACIFVWQLSLASPLVIVPLFIFARIYLSVVNLTEHIFLGHSKYFWQWGGMNNIDSWNKDGTFMIATRGVPGHSHSQTALA